MLKEKTYGIINLSVAVLLLNIYGLILVSNMLYYHSHVAHDGSIVSHAHPFNKQNDNGPYKTHHHSKMELLLFFSDNYNLDEIQTEIKGLPFFNFDQYPAYSNVSVLPKEFSPDSSRAPPKA